MCKRFSALPLYVFSLFNAPSVALCSSWPEIAVLAYSIMAELPIWKECWSMYNLTSFRIWFENYATADEQESALHLYIRDHVAKTPYLDALGVEVRIVPVILNPDHPRT